MCCTYIHALTSEEDITVTQLHELSRTTIDNKNIIIKPHIKFRFIRQDKKQEAQFLNPSTCSYPF